MPLTRFRRANLLLNPAVLAILTWTVVGGLYALHLSKLLLFSTEDVVRVVALIVLPVACISLCFWIAYQSQQQVRPLATVVMPQPDLAYIDRRLKVCLILWIALAIFETIVSGGVPALWLITGSSKTYFDYGIASMHGMVNALLLALSTTSFALYLFSGKRAYLRLPIFTFFWCLVLITRGTLIVLVVECVLLYLRFRRVRWTSFIKLAALATALLFIFGVVGDFRSGAETFRDLAQPTSDFPAWAPSGLLWAYIYITTPINNLLYSMHILTPVYNPLLPNTAITLFPSVIRTLVYGPESAQSATGGSLVVEALNVSTAYVGPFLDMGRWGIAGFSAVAGLLAEIYWRRNGFRNLLIYAVFAQALVLSLFYNLLFSLPILGQIVWFIYLTHMPKAARAGQNSGLENEYA